MKNRTLQTALLSLLLGGLLLTPALLAQEPAPTPTPDEKAQVDRRAQLRERLQQMREKLQADREALRTAVEAHGRDSEEARKAFQEFRQSRRQMQIARRQVVRRVGRFAARQRRGRFAAGRGDCSCCQPFNRRGRGFRPGFGPGPNQEGGPRPGNRPPQGPQGPRP